MNLIFAKFVNRVMIFLVQNKNSKTEFFSLRRYTLTKASPASPMLLQTLKEDASAGFLHPRERKQGRVANQLSEGPYRLVRTIDLDACVERVFTAKASK